MQILRTLAALLALAPLASAGDFWIDPVNGSDTASGSSPLDPWQTLTHALATIGPASQGGSTDTLHLLPGTFSELSGETFPIQLREALTIVGAEGATSTFVAGRADQPTFTLANAAIVNEPLILSGLTIWDGETALLTTPSIPGVQVLVEDCIIRQNGYGFRSEPSFAGGTTILTLSRTSVRSNGTGIGLVRSATVRIWDSTLRNNMWGVYARTSGGAFGGAVDLDVERSRFLNNDWGIYLRPMGNNLSMDLDMSDTLLADNNFAVDREEDDGPVQIDIARCTLADNGVGLNIWFTANDPVSVEDSILFGNGADVFGNEDAITFGNTLTGVDPLFVDASTRDYRLAYGSPAVDAGQASVDTVDQTGQERDVDGDGDLIVASDIGAYELRTLSGPESVGIGETLELELFGEAGGRSRIFFQRGLPLLTPFSTQYGDLFLSQVGLRELGFVNHGAGPAPATIPVGVPSDVSLIGQSFSFQAVSTSSASASGGALTSVATVTIEM